MKLFSSQTYQNRRNELKKLVGKGQIILMGNNESPFNYTDNTYRFRQDSSFLYFFGVNLPNLVGFIDIDNNEEIIFGNEYTLDDIIWIGKHESLNELCSKVGIQKLESPAKIINYIKSASCHYLDQYRADNKILLSQYLNQSVAQLQASQVLIESIIKMRAIKSADEIIQMTEAVNITRNMHIAAMKAAKVGKMEYEVLAKVIENMHSQNGELAYPVILSVHGQTLHNHYHGNKLQDGQLLLNDAGAENEMCYAGDITRTFPVNGKFSETQKYIYELVLKMETDAIASLKPEILYRDVHLTANKTLLEGLKNFGLLKGNVEDMLTIGLAGMFMPHGLGHMIGLDVHDMENLGENNIGYRKGIERSTLLGLKSLRYAKELHEGLVLTVEPGIYFIPDLIEKFKSETQYNEFVNFDKLSEFYNFGGIRIEDNVLITKDSHHILGDSIPKTVAEIEEIMA